MAAHSASEYTRDAAAREALLRELKQIGQPFVLAKRLERLGCGVIRGDECVTHVSPDFECAGPDRGAKIGQQLARGDIHRPHGIFEYAGGETAPAGVRDSDELSDRLAASGIGSAPGSAFGESSANAIRFSFSCATSMVREGAEAVRAALTSTAPLAAG